MKAVEDRLRYVVDVGANRGDWTSIVRERKTLDGALLFEPSLSALQILRSRFSRYPALEIIDAAAGNAPGSVIFFEEKNAGETSSLIAGFSQESNSENGTDHDP